MKKFRTLGYVLSLALGMTMLTGCGKKVDGVDQQSMIDKYAAYCDLPDYKGLEYEETKSTVTDADVKTKIDSLLQQYATKTQVKEGTSRKAIMSILISLAVSMARNSKVVIRMVPVMI